ncbi:MAG: membrane protein insertion efficiency factor YidD [Candidatus Gracilibacteria bacterium]|nr:membrane protein insertion efficiency factor YidD [Candidatus Gracilibacteria bacterium]
MLDKIIINGVKGYQKVLSPDHSFWAKAMNTTPYCMHIPTCSEYMIEAVQKKGTLIGTAKGIARIGRCMPWNKGGYDPVDKEEK